MTETTVEKRARARQRLRPLTESERAAVRKYPVKTDEVLRDFVKLWRGGKAFYVTGVVSAPYDGCFHEPNIWLVTPPGCSEHASLNAGWKPRYARAKERLAALAEVNTRAAEIYQEKSRLEEKVRPHVERCGRDWQLISAQLPAGATIEEQQIVMDQVRWALGRIKDLEAEGAQLETDIVAINERFPAKPELPPAVVFPLYASGQGAAVDVLWSLEDCLEWLHSGELPRVISGETEEDGSTKYRDSRLVQGSFWGGFDSFTVAPMGPISELPPSEHYWGAAIRIAYERWGLELSWKCVECEREIVGTDEDDSSPHWTGYRGNGGIGVFMEGGLCADCFQRGCCKACEGAGEADHELWDPAVFHHGLDICEWHAAALAKLLCVSSAEYERLEKLGDAVEPVVLCLKWVQESPEQELIAGVERALRLVLEDKDGGQIPVQVADEDGLDTFVNRNDLADLLDPKWGDGIYLLAEHVASRMEPETEEDE